MTIAAEVKGKAKMEKYIKVFDIEKEHPQVFSGEEIADSVRGVVPWIWNGSVWKCGKCGCGSKDKSRFCKYCGAKMYEAN